MNVHEKQTLSLDQIQMNLEVVIKFHCGFDFFYDCILCTLAAICLLFVCPDVTFQKPIDDECVCLCLSIPQVSLLFHQ